MSSGSDRSISDEVVRIEAIGHLSGPVAHALGSFSFLVLGAGLVVLGWDDLVVGPLVVAWLVSLNGLSLYGWEWLLDAVESRGRRPEDDPSRRTLSAPSLSVEHRAELVAGVVQAVALVLVVGLTIGTLRWFGVVTGAYLLAGLIATGNIGVLVLAVRRWKTVGS